MESCNGSERKEAIEEVVKGREMKSFLKTNNLSSREDGNNGDGSVSLDQPVTHVPISFSDTNNEDGNNGNGSVSLDQAVTHVPVSFSDTNNEGGNDGDGSRNPPPVFDDRKDLIRRRIRMALEVKRQALEFIDAHLETDPSWTVDTPTPVADGHAWRKYGQKDIPNAKYPRNYFRCTHRSTQGCQAAKQVQRLDDVEPCLFRTTYYGHHTCTNPLKAYYRDQIELLILITSLVLEAMSAVFEQLQYALLGMVMAILGLIFCLIELAYKVRKENATWELRGSLPWIYSRHPHHRLFGSIVDYFGLVAALWQLFHSTIGYLFALQGKGNPIKMTVVMFLFSFCLLLREFMLRYSKMSPRHSTEP